MPEGQKQTVRSNRTISVAKYLPVPVSSKVNALYMLASNLTSRAAPAMLPEVTWKEILLF